MQVLWRRQSYFVQTLVLLAGFLAFVAGPNPAAAQSAAHKQAIAQAAAKDRVLLDFYRDTKFEPVWTGRGRMHRMRREALLAAMESAPDHGLPGARYSAKDLSSKMKSARKASDRGVLDVYLSKLYLSYAADIGSGIIDPRSITAIDGDGKRTREIARKRPIRSPRALMDGFVAAKRPNNFLDGLSPKSAEYTRLMKARLDLEKQVKRGGWGPEVTARRLEMGDTGAATVALRNRLVAMGYLKRTSTKTYDDKIAKAVQAFQSTHGLNPDGIVGPGTLEMINTSPQTRMAQIIVAMERERWTNFDRGTRHVEVNITDYHARIIDKGTTTFITRAVVGAASNDRRTPEFSDEMEHMIFNPSWYVPRSIATNEYLPLFQEDPNALSHLEMLDDNGNRVSRAAVDFASLDKDTWPFLLREPPSRGNALGQVKFMFPNRHNIYLHDTPAKSLFGKERRAFSHGCIRLGDPFGFAEAILKRESNDPKGLIRTALNRSKEYQVDLKRHIPVHLIYRTARVDAKGRMQFRADIYGRDAKIWRALEAAGVALGSKRS